MSLAQRLLVVFVGTALAGGAPGASLADPAPEPAPICAGHAYVNLSTGSVSWNRVMPSTLAGVDVYSNLASPVNFGISSIDLAAEWGDRVTTTGVGAVDEIDFTVFNSGTSAGNLLTASFAVTFYDGPSFTLLGGFSTVSVGFGGGLPPGYYTYVSVVGLSPLAINLNATDAIVVQRVLNATGTADRLGVVSQDPPTIGSSITAMYINASTVGPAGFYAVPGQNANTSYRVNVIPPPVPAPTTSWGRIKSLYR